MRPSNATWNLTVLVSAAALLSFLARTFIDYRFVYAEMGVDASRLGYVTLINLAFYAGWIAAIVAASHGRRIAMWVLLGYNVLLILFGAYTMTTLCPSPCRTGWPVGEAAIWSNVLVGVAAAALAVLSLARRRGAVAP